MERYSSREELILVAGKREIHPKSEPNQFLCREFWHFRFWNSDGLYSVSLLSEILVLAKHFSNPLSGVLGKAVSR